MPHPDMSESWVNGHPDEGWLHEWLDEQLSAENASKVEQHVSACEECRGLVAEARGLIAASHRILSALDDVPANVIPAAQNSGAQEKLGARLDEMRRERAAAAAATAVPRRSNVWRRLGAMAALLLVALVPATYFLGGDDVTVPNDTPASDVAAATATGPATQTATPPQDVRVAAAPAGENENRAAKSTIAADAGNAQRESKAPSAVFSAPLQGQVATSTRGEIVSGISAAPPRVAQSSTLADSAAMKSSARAEVGSTLPVLPEPTIPGALLQGKVAGVQIRSPGNSSAAAGAAAGASVANEQRSAVTSPQPAATPPVSAPLASPPVVVADKARQTTAARGAAAAKASEATATSVPQLANAPAGRPVVDTGLVSRARGDSLGTNAEIARAFRRAAGASTEASDARGSTLQLRGAGGRALSLDSVVLTRTICAAACETTVLEMLRNGAVRYSVSSGSVRKPVVTSALSGELLAAITSQVFAWMPEVISNNPVRCTLSRPSGSVLLEILVVRAGAGMGDGRCSAGEAALLRLGASVDSIVGTEALRRRVR